MDDLVTVAAPDGAVAQFDIASTGARYTARDGGMYDVPPRVAKLIREQGGFSPNVGGAVKRVMPNCPQCGFATYFVTCSRCGHDRREAPIAVRPQDLAPVARGIVFGASATMARQTIGQRVAQAARVVTG